MEQTVIGYVYDSNGMHEEPLYFEGTIDNIVSFIMIHADSRTVITDSLDQMYVSSMQGGFLDRPGELYKDKIPALREAILPLQFGEKEPSEIKYFKDEIETMEMEME